MVSEASGSTGTTQEPYTYFNHQQQPEPRGRAPRSNRASKRSSTVIDSCKSSGHAHGPYTRPHIPSSAQCYRANGCRGMRAAESGSGEERAAMALTALQCTAPCSVHLCHSCHLSPRCRGGWCPRATQSIRCEHARYARLHRGCCTAHLREEALHADDVLRAAGGEKLYQESESSAKMTGSRMGFASRG